MPHRTILLNLLKNYECSEAKEYQKMDRFISFVVSNSDCFLRSNLKGHITASALLISPNKKSILLTHHKKIGKWLQLGGHADGLSDVFEVAMKEAKEESGIETIYANNKEIFDFDIHLIEEHKGVPEHYHYDVRFIFYSDTLEYKISDESNELKWVDVADIIEQPIYEESLKKMAKKYASDLRKQF